ncbi:MULTISPECIES: polyphosphate kinase 2 family protein [unclassified Oleiphilus]|jgi:PPK2 family polyphosphate:nucleotide phosphotransferase|nr:MULTISPECIES: PPK2 family polyphosphate kinase [unclassified Oleiphilus]KZY46157.1 polyphosphate kinase [Oleiphilus sp. HI0050]KZY79340.1 polyphosphate kinase [Oleiphilus sp. HI0068]KZY84531.1 polyphosphate kinase [Oleiphilus sp. HI0069]KZY88944.1 polyphosphate kinase [Oleiphilus sp. HI0072]KZZ07767.1 polyphosphate kinase [Oleiphilus sp. HI0078]KZZ21765.1 polyphosphate kinase [Oleiphilus sp. HI0081]
MKNITHPASPVILEQKPPNLSKVNFDQALIESKSQYTKALKSCQERLLQIQQAYYRQGKRAIIVFEGWDASGKGGVIRRISEKLDPRGFRVYPISAPHPDEQGRHYLYRFQTRLPKPGTLAIFDRSYYGRVLVERVEGFAPETAWQRAYQEINEFERMLTDDGVHLIKFFLHITPEEQLKRFELRLNTPEKQWKLTEEDIRNRLKWDDYTHASNDMFRFTSTEASPWNVVPANHKWSMRVAVMQKLNDQLVKGVDITPPALDPKLVKAAKKHLGLEI